MLNLFIFLITINSLTLGYENYNKEVTCMAEAIYYEARGESNKGKLAVGHVILNRIKSGYGDSCNSVVSAPKQFSWFRKKKQIIEKDRWNECLTISNQIVNKKTVDPTNGSIFFHEKTVHPNWKYKKTVSIGNHIFYRKN